nr:unnamed protein product [Callosobruchus chinensis]
MTRLEEQRQPVSQAIETSQKQVEEQLATTQKQQLQQVKGDVKEIAREQLRELGAGERSLTAVAPAFLDRHSGMIEKLYPYDGMTSWDVYYLKFENIARMRKKLVH